MPELVNPYSKWGISQGWTSGSHKNNPAIDYPMPVGTPLQSPAAGRIRLQHWNGSRSGGNPGNKVIVDLPNGRSIHLAHLSSFGVSHGQYVQQLGNLGRSGNTGDVRPLPTRANPNSGAHLHTFGTLPNGARWNWTLDASVPAGGGSKPFEPGEEDMPLNDADKTWIMNAIRSIQGVPAAGRGDYERLADLGDIGQVLTAIENARGGPHKTRNDYARGLDLGDKGEILDAIAAVSTAAGSSGGPTADQIAEAVRELFRTDPLT